MSKTLSTRVASPAAVAGALAATDATTAAPGVVATAVDRKPQLTILVVDDSDMTRKMVMHKLRMLGHACLEADDGLQAVSTVLKSLLGSGIGSMSSLGSDYSSSHGKAIDLVLIDSSMPRMVGADATFEMRRWGYNGIIVAVSGDDNREEFIDAGADAFLQKPMHQKLLDAIIREHFAVADDGTTYNKTRGPPVARIPSIESIISYGVRSHRMSAPVDGSGAIEELMRAENA